MSLTEILIAAVLLALAAIPMLTVFHTSSQSIGRTDQRREARHYIGSILEHMKRQSLHDLWKNFGPWDVAGLDAAAGRLRDRIAELDQQGKLVNGNPDAVNPLGFTQDFLDEMRRDGYVARVRFEFYTRRELGVAPLGFNSKVKVSVSRTIGLHHMLAGWAEVRLLVLGSNEQIARVVEPIMCPAIVGRPGMRLSSCPAVNEKVRREYGPLLARREGNS
jgi:hypothetical protein